MTGRAKKIGLSLVGFLFFGNILAWYVVFEISKLRVLEVSFFDVGQGDATFIETQEKHQILIDGGPDKTILQKLAEEMPFYDKSIDLIILTHPESDHMAGLIEVLKAYKVDYILWTGIVKDTTVYEEWLKTIEQERAQSAQIKISQSGQKISAGEVEFVILYPFENLESKSFEDSNDASIVAKLNFGKISFLFTGDIYESGEKQLIAKYDDLDSNVLKISHHGSKTSTSNEFLAEVMPNAAVIQCGKNNSYGHPHQDVLETLEKYNIEILRTDESGDIKLISDGNQIQIYEF